MKQQKHVRRGRQMRTGSSWRLIKGDRMFCGTLLKTFMVNGRRLAIFSVPIR